jgi:hypothetical protein
MNAPSKNSQFPNKGLMINTIKELSKKENTLKGLLIFVRLEGVSPRFIIFIGLIFHGYLSLSLSLSHTHTHTHTHTIHHPR